MKYESDVFEKKKKSEFQKLYISKSSGQGVASAQVAFLESKLERSEANTRRGETHPALPKVHRQVPLRKRQIC